MNEPVLELILTTRDVRASFEQSIVLLPQVFVIDVGDWLPSNLHPPAVAAPHPPTAVLEGEQAAHASSLFHEGDELADLRFLRLPWAFLLLGEEKLVLSVVGVALVASDMIFKYYLHFFIIT